jgi:hypothetical protein
VIFYTTSFAASRILHDGVLGAELAGDMLLEDGVLADMKGEPSAAILRKSLDKFKESRGRMNDLYAKLDEMRAINDSKEGLPEYDSALRKILEDHAPLERVSLRHVRFSNVALGHPVLENNKPFGRNMGEILASIQEDLLILQKQLDELIQAFTDVLPVAERGGFAAMVLSGRAAFPEKVLRNAELSMVFAQFVDRACTATIAADMLVYPRGLEWLLEPSKK